MNFCIKKHFFSREIDYIEVQSKMTILIHFKNSEITVNDYIEIDFKEFNRISIDMFSCLDHFFPGVAMRPEMPSDQQKKLLYKTNQEKPDGK